MGDLEPGPEMDALVAEKVMGWARTEKGKALREGNVVWCGDVDWDPLAREIGMPLFHPSTSIADAWEVVKKLRGSGHHFELQAILNEHEDDGFECCLALSGASDAWAPTAPHAICLAALKAVGAIE